MKEEQLPLKQAALRDIAHARSGDKGNHANIGVIAYNQVGYDYLKKELTEKKMEKFFSSLSPRQVIRYELPNLLAFNFILEGVLDGGGSRSLRIDAQGKALGQAVLEMPLQLPADVLQAAKKEVLHDL